MKIRVRDYNKVIDGHLSKANNAYETQEGKRYAKISSSFGLDGNNLKTVYLQILRDATAFLQYIKDNLDTLKGGAEI